LTTIDRSQFLRLGAVGLGAGLLGGPVGTAAAQAPLGDDRAFVRFGAIAELVSAEFYARARRAPKVGGDLQRRLAAVRDVKRAQFRTLNGLLGDDPVLLDDYGVVFGPRGFASVQRIAALGERIETLAVGVYLTGLRDVTDPATRLVLGRALAYDAQQRAWMIELQGASNPTRTPGALTLEEAGRALDRFLEIPGVEPS
jgi:Ferritin-like domain